MAAFDSVPESRNRIRPASSRAVLLLCLCIAIYLANLWTVPLARGGDTIPNRLVPFAILSRGTVTLDLFRGEFKRAGVRTWYLRETPNGLSSFYPAGTAIAALPVFAPIYAVLALGGVPAPALMFAVAEPVEKLAATTITATAIVLFFFTVCRFMEARTAFGCALAFAFATSMWATSSQMLWQQTAVAFALTVAIWQLTAPGLPPRAAALAGAALSLAVLARPTSALLLAAGAAAAFLTPGAASERRARLFALVAGATPLLVLALTLNLRYFDNPAGGYGLIASGYRHGLVSLDRLFGAAGLLVSPNRGLFVYTPVALLGVAGLCRQIRPGGPRDPLLASFGIAALAHLLLVGTYNEWWGGWSFGPRYLVDILPLLAFAAADM